MNKKETSWYRWEGDELLLSLRVQPRASSDKFVGPHGNEYKLRITAPPVDGKANEHLRRFLAKAFAVPGARVVLEAGHHAKTKRIRIRDPKSFPIPVDRRTD